MRSQRWNPPSNDLEGLLFDGAPELLSQLDDMVVRPRPWWRETLLPIIFLVCAPTARNPLDGLADRLRQARGVLHSRINGRETPPADDGPTPEKSIRQLLDGVVADLSQRSDRRRPLRFPHYSLAVWLTSLVTNHTVSHQADQPERRVDNAFQDFIKERYRFQNKTTSAEASLINEIPSWVRIMISLLPPLGLRLMRLFWRPPHWIASNRISSTHSSGSFRGLARKFMEQGSGERQHEIQQNDIDRLLVDAFMEDLRRGYRPTTLFLFGRRRTTYPVLLMDNIELPGAGHHLLELISDSRTDHLRMHTAGPGRQPRERAYFHPLLIIAQGSSAALERIRPSNYRAEHHDGYAMAEIKYYRGEWRRKLTDSDRTWFFSLRVPIEDPPAGLRTKLTEFPLPDAPRPVMPFAAAALLIAAASITTYSTYYEHCGAWYWEPQLQREDLPAGRFQCVGLGSSDHRFFDDVGDINGIRQELADNLNEVETTIHQANQRAVMYPNYLTVVYLSELSSQDASDYQQELEVLRGIAVAQQKRMDNQPLRILMANAGDGMDYGITAAEAVAREAREDPTLVAVVGLGVSREGTRDAIIRLGDARIPMIGTTISATDLASNTSQYYHQVGPTNRREAEVGAFYAATRLGARDVSIYYSGDEDDLYSNDLKTQAEAAFETRGLRVTPHPYRVDSDDAGDEIYSAGRDACDVGSDGMVFYAGRTAQLSVFLDGMQSNCEGDYPEFLAGDDVGRFVLDGRLNDYPGLTIDYLIQASSLTWGPDCSVAGASVSFFDDYRELFDEGACSKTRGGGSILAYDTLQVFFQGVQYTGAEGLPSRDKVLAGVDDISGEGSLSGVSGRIDYPRDQGVPADKAILVIRGQASEQLERKLLCGRHDTAQPPSDNC